MAANACAAVWSTSKVMVRLSQVCSIARALEVIGERWSPLIVRDAHFAGVTRFNDFQHNLGIATNILKARLDAFVEAGIMVRRRYSAHPEQFEYLLTGKGRDLVPALIGLTQWGDKWAAPDGPPIRYRHTGCDGEITVQAVCEHCGTTDHQDVAATLGPGMPAEYVAQRRPERGG